MAAMPRPEGARYQAFKNVELTALLRTFASSVALHFGSVGDRTFSISFIPMNAIRAPYAMRARANCIADDRKMFRVRLLLYANSLTVTALSPVLMHGPIA
jgi:hypothetical protein